nr:hypothetical protein Ade03nite_84660 [Actinoplanes derwentensis]
MRASCRCLVAVAWCAAAVATLCNPHRGAPTLQQIMGPNGVAAYEESLIETLLAGLIAALDE